MPGSKKIKTRGASEPVASAEASIIFSALRGPTETVAASIPKDLAEAVRRQIPKGEFSRFVADSMRRELVRRSRATLVRELLAEVGQLDPNEVAEIDAAIRN